MKTVLQRVSRAEVRVAGEPVSRIGRGILLLVAVERGDGPRDVEATARKLLTLRLFSRHLPEASPAVESRTNGDGGMSLTLAEVGGACLVVSQFTLAAALDKGSRPSFGPAADPAVAEPLYLQLVAALRAAGVPVETGRFGADMEVELVNDGPATFLVFTREGALVKSGRGEGAPGGPSR